MTSAFYPDLAVSSLRVLMLAEPGQQITPALVERATGAASNCAEVIADLDRVHMIDDSHELTPLADRYAAMCRRAIDLD